MKVFILGTSHAAQYLKTAIQFHGGELDCAIFDADLIFVAEDTPTEEYGARDQSIILDMVKRALASRHEGAQIVITSQVEPGFTRSFGVANIFHQAETLRIKDAFERALHPEYIIVGGEDCPNFAYAQYLSSYRCPLVFGTWEDAEFSKIAVNMMLAAQVDYANALSAAARKCGANWDKVCEALRLDKRIGPHAYLTPGRWEDSRHLLRDSVTLQKICTAENS